MESPLYDIEILMEYMLLRPSATGLKQKILVDDCEAYTRYEHELLLYMQNGEHKSLTDFVPITISDSPRIVGPRPEWLSNEDFDDVREFIIKNRTRIRQLTDQTLSQTDFFHSIEKINR